MTIIVSIVGLLCRPHRKSVEERNDDSFLSVIEKYGEQPWDVEYETKTKQIVASKSYDGVRFNSKPMKGVLLDGLSYAHRQAALDAILLASKVANVVKG